MLLAWDAPASSLSAGWARYVLERRYGIVPTAMRVASLGRADISRFDVVVLPSGTYTPHIAGDLLRRLKDWVGAGRTLVTIGEASRWARARTWACSTRGPNARRQPGTEAPPKPKTETPKQPIDYDKAISPAERPELVPGAILRVTLDGEHWLAAGTDGEVPAMVESQRVFTPITLDKGRNVGVYATKDRLVAAGIVWPSRRPCCRRRPTSSSSRRGAAA